MAKVARGRVLLPPVAGAALFAWGCIGPNPRYNPEVGSAALPEPSASRDLAPELAGQPDTGSEPVPGADAGSPEIADVPSPSERELGSAGPPQVTAGLLSSWPLDQPPPTGTTSIPDTLGNTATFRGGIAWIADRPEAAGPGGAPVFNGTDAHAELTFASNRRAASTGTKTVALWFKYTGGSAIRPTLIALYNSTRTEDVGLQIGLSAGGGQVAVWRYGRSFDALVFAISANVWHHAAVSYEGTTHILYVNGVERQRSTTWVPRTGVLDVGRLGTWDPTTENAKYAGLICDVRVYDRALSVAEIRTLAGLSP